MLSRNEVEKRLSRKGIVLLGKYHGCELDHKFKCSHGHTWTTKAELPLKGYGCPVCQRRSLSDIESILKKNGIKIVGEYPGLVMSPCKFRCRQGHEWVTSTISIIRRGKRGGTGCPQCWRLDLLKSEKQLKKLGILPIFQLINSSTRTWFQCQECLYKFKTSVSHILRDGTRCPQCMKCARLTQAIIEQRLKKRRIRLLDKFKTVKIMYKLQCLRCHTTWKSYLHANCPICHSTESVKEKEVRAILQKIFPGKKFPRSKPKFLRGLGKQPLELDCYNKELKVAVEVQGQQHYQYVPRFHRNLSGFLRQKRRDARKRMSCYRHKVKLICIPHWQKNAEEYLRARLKSQ